MTKTASFAVVRFTAAFAAGTRFSGKIDKDTLLAIATAVYEQPER